MFSDTLYEMDRNTEVLYETTFHKDSFRKKSGKYFPIDYGYRV